VLQLAEKIINLHQITGFARNTDENHLESVTTHITLCYTICCNIMWSWCSLSGQPL